MCSPAAYIPYTPHIYFGDIVLHGHVLTILQFISLHMGATPMHNGRAFWFVLWKHISYI